MSAGAVTLNGASAHSVPASNNETCAQSAVSEMHDKVLHQFAQFETSRRLIACLVNEGMIDASVDQSGYLNLRQPKESKESKESKGPTVRVGLTGDAAKEWLESTSKPYLQPSELSVPIMIRREQDGQAEDVAETDPTVLFSLMSPWFTTENTSQEAIDTITRQLKSSAENQGTADYVWDISQVIQLLTIHPQRSGSIWPSISTCQPSPIRPSSGSRAS